MVTKPVLFVRLETMGEIAEGGAVAQVTIGVFLQSEVLFGQATVAYCRGILSILATLPIRLPLCGRLDRNKSQDIGPRNLLEQVVVSNTSIQADILESE